MNMETDCSEGPIAKTSFMSRIIFLLRFDCSLHPPPPLHSLWRVVVPSAGNQFTGWTGQRGGRNPAARFPFEVRFFNHVYRWAQSLSINLSLPHEFRFLLLFLRSQPLVVSLDGMPVIPVLYTYTLLSIVTLVHLLQSLLHR